MALGIVFSALSFSGLIASLVVLLLLRRQLRRVLVDVCEGEHRAEFWVALSGVWIVLLGVLAGTATLGYWTPDGGLDLFGGATTQVRYLLVGLLGAVLSIAAVLLYAIQRSAAPPAPRWVAPPPAGPTAPHAPRDTRAAQRG